jgi:very-short-patch-repair endonuclease
MKTIVYIDGFNLYYGAVRKTPYRWLNSNQPSAHLSGLAPTVTLPPPLPPQMDLHTGEAARYSRKASILTKPEQKTYQALCLAAGGDFQVMSKVRLWDFIRLENDPAERKQHLNRLSCRHVDFLLCEPITLKPLLVIELDDDTHQTPYAQDSDRYKDELFEAAGMPLLRLDRPNIPPQQLRARIEDIFERATKNPTT